MVTIPVFIRTANRRTPFIIAIVRAQIRHHDDNTLPRIAAGAAGRAGRQAGGGQLVAYPAAGAAPGEARGAEERLRARCCVDAGGDAELQGGESVCRTEEEDGLTEMGMKRRTDLPGEHGGSGCGPAATGSFLAIVVTLRDMSVSLDFD
jgi:hypothetical protein